jgi:hypothetical protein
LAVIRLVIRRTEDRQAGLLSALLVAWICNDFARGRLRPDDDSKEIRRFDEDDGLVRELAS